MWRLKERERKRVWMRNAPCTMHTAQPITIRNSWNSDCDQIVFIMGKNACGMHSHA